jgi:mRNA interferase RelE/StbE
LPYDIRLSRQAARDLRSLPRPVQIRVKQVLDGLIDEARPRGVVKLAGEASLYRIRTGDYRIIFEVLDQPQMVRVARIRHRRDAYR